ncbi:MAG: hypothetical protein SynsKO_07640 [Synoicihabitans sp.]
MTKLVGAAAALIAIFIYAASLPEIHGDPRWFHWLVLPLAGGPGWVSAFVIYMFIAERRKPK